MEKEFIPTADNIVKRSLGLQDPEEVASALEGMYQTRNLRSLAKDFSIPPGLLGVIFRRFKIPTRSSTTGLKIAFSAPEEQGGHSVTPSQTKERLPRRGTARVYIAIEEVDARRMLIEQVRGSERWSALTHREQEVLEGRYGDPERLHTTQELAEKLATSPPNITVTEYRALGKLDKIINGEPINEHERKKHVRLGDHPKERLQALINQGLSMHKIGEILGTTGPTVKKWLEEFGIAINREKGVNTGRLGRGDELTQEARDLYRQAKDLGLLDRLTPRQRAVLEARLDGPAGVPTLDAVSEQLGGSRQAIKQAETYGLRRLQRVLSSSDAPVSAEGPLPFFRMSIDSEVLAPDTMETSGFIQRVMTDVNRPSLFFVDFAGINLTELQEKWRFGSYEFEPKANISHLEAKPRIPWQLGMWPEGLRSANSKQALEWAGYRSVSQLLLVSVATQMRRLETIYSLCKQARAETIMESVPFIDQDSFGEFLRRTLKASGTQKQFAMETGLSQAVISNIITGRGHSFRTFMKVVEGLGLPDEEKGYIIDKFGSHLHPEEIDALNINRLVKDGRWRRHLKRLTPGYLKRAGFSGIEEYLLTWSLVAKDILVSIREMITNVPEGMQTNISFGQDLYVMDLEKNNLAKDQAQELLLELAEKGLFV